jgi:hypothetical protein
MAYKKRVIWDFVFLLLSGFFILTVISYLSNIFIRKNQRFLTSYQRRKFNLQAGCTRKDILGS